MGRQIFKYVYGHRIKEKIITMPKDANIVKVSIQDKDICIWAEFKEDEEKTEDRKFCLYMTGHDIVPNFAIHVKTLLLNDGSFVVHLYELK